MKNFGLMLWPLDRRPAIEPSVASCIAGHKRDTPLSGERLPGGCRGCIIPPLARDDIGSSALTKQRGRGIRGGQVGTKTRGVGGRELTRVLKVTCKASEREKRTPWRGEETSNAT